MTDNMTYPAFSTPTESFPTARGEGMPRLRGRTPLARDQLRLSVLVPIYNERHTIELILDQIHAVAVSKEVICVNDCSTDGTAEILERLAAAGRIDKLIHQAQNMGKGKAIRTALAESTGNVVIVQDADLEYDPADWPGLLEPSIDGVADAC